MPAVSAGSSPRPGASSPVSLALSQTSTAKAEPSANLALADASGVEDFQNGAVTITQHAAGVRGLDDFKGRPGPTDEDFHEDL